jgi:hypothetical protein
MLLEFLWRRNSLIVPSIWILFTHLQLIIVRMRIGGSNDKTRAARVKDEVRTRPAIVDRTSSISSKIPSCRFFLIRRGKGLGGEVR